MGINMANDDELRALATAINAAGAGSWTAAPLVPGASPTGEKIAVTNPADRREVAGHWQSSDSATVERALPDVFGDSGEITLNLHQNDFTTVARMVAALNNAFGEGAARAVDGVTVAVQAPTDPGARIGLLARIENIELSPGTAPAKVVVNSRTGTVVIGAQVRVSPAAIAHGSLTVTVSESTQISQPNAFAGGQTVAAPQSTITASNEGSRMFRFDGGATLDEIVRAVNEVGAAPGDLIAILEALKQAGALSAELEVI